MLKVTKWKKRGMVYHVIDQRPTGEVLQFRNRFDADKKLAELKLIARKFGSENILSSRDYVDAAHAVEILQGKTSLVEAAKHWMANYDSKNISLESLMADCIKNKRATNRRESHLEKLEQCETILNKTFPGAMIADVTPIKMEEFLAKQTTWNSRTKYGFMINVQTFFNFAVRREYVARNPLGKMEKILVDESEVHIFSVDECKRLMATVKEYAPNIPRRKNLNESRRGFMLPYYTLCLFCGLRPSEVLQFTWDDIDLDRKQVKVASGRSKSRRNRFVTISANAAQWLSLKGELPPPRIDRHHDRIKAVANVTWHHDILRHSFGSYHFAQHRDERLTTNEMGNSPSVFYDSYRKLVTRDDAKLFWGILP